MFLPGKMSGVHCTLYTRGVCLLFTWQDVWCTLYTRGICLIFNWHDVWCTLYTRGVCLLFFLARWPVYTLHKRCLFVVYLARCLVYTRSHSRLRISGTGAPSAGRRRTFTSIKSLNLKFVYIIIQTKKAKENKTKDNTI